MANSRHFTKATAARALAEACEYTHLDASSAQLVRLGENALYAVPSEGLVVRIARSVDLAQRVDRELEVARWLARLGFPATRVAERVSQPIEVCGRLVTFWELVHLDPGAAASLEDLGRILAELHRLPPPPFKLPRFDPFSVVSRRLAAPGGADLDDVAFLRVLHERLVGTYANLRFPRDLGLIHGDAHRGNLLVCSDGVLLSDFEVVAFGPRVWDLAVTAVARSRFGLSSKQYESFVKAYGYDVTEWAGYETLRAVRELTMTTWLMQNVGEDERVAEEFRVRVSSMREGDHDRRWHPF